MIGTRENTFYAWEPKDRFLLLFYLFICLIEKNKSYEGRFVRVGAAG